MLFILVMDVLCYMVQQATAEDLLQLLARRALQHRISLYADVVVIFLRPAAADIDITLDLLHLFGNALDLKTNIQKSSVLPIQCGEEDRETIQAPSPLPDAGFSLQIPRNTPLRTEIGQGSNSTFNRRPVT
jgi:hypothetical protein